MDAVWAIGFWNGILQQYSMVSWDCGRGDESMTQACVMGRRDGCDSVNLGGTAGFPVPIGMEIRLFLQL